MGPVHVTMEHDDGDRAVGLGQREPVGGWYICLG